METTRQTILNILRRRSATVEDLTSELRLAPATVRRHLDILARDGHVDIAQERLRTGRPRYIFSLSEKGEDLFPKHYVRITNRLINEIVGLSADDTRGRSGRELAELVFEKMAQHLAQRVGPKIYGSTLDERLRSTVETLVEEGILFDIEKKGDGSYLLVGHGCPCPRVGDGSAACTHDQRLLSLLLGADVVSVEPELAGREASCAYRVTARTRAEFSLPGRPAAV
jgi:predicted ArsR family transcriptional regulator